MISNLKNFLTSHSPISQVLSLVALLTPVVALYATKGIIILFSLAVLVCFFTFIFTKENPPAYPKSLNLSVLALTVWAVASLIWTISSDLSWSVAYSIPITMLGGLLIITSIKTLNATNRAIINQSIIGGFLFGGSLILVEITTDFSVSKVVHILKTGGIWNLANYSGMRSFVINNGVSLIEMFLWPALMILCTQNRYKLAFLGFVATIFIITKSVNFAATVAVGVGSISFLIAFYAPRIAYKFAAIGVTLAILGIPFTMTALPDARTIGKHLPELAYSVYPRLVIWQYASNLVMEKPLVGHGIRTSRDLSKTDTKIKFLYRDKGKIHSGNTENIPLHPHNGLIQIWLELGAGGALLGLILVLCILWNISKCCSTKIGKALAFAALASSLCLISVSYGLWQSWWLASLWLQGSLMTISLIQLEDS